MNVSADTDASRPWALYASIGVGVVLILLALVLAGWHSAPEGPVTGEVEPELAGAVCQEQLMGILRAVDPRELGLSSLASDRAQDLNLWQADCGSVLVDGRIAEDEELVRRLLPAEAAEATLSPRFTPRDVEHLRTAILLRQVAEHLVAGIDDPAQQAVRLFDYVCRTVLDPRGVDLELTPYEVLLFGIGSAEHRAWVFAGMLRQIELDAVLIEPIATGDAAPHWLVGVSVGTGEASRILLFDPRLGLPIPSAEEASSEEVFVTRPAALEEVRENDALFRALDTKDHPYPLQAEQFQKVRIGLIGDSSLWSNRVAVLNFTANIRGASLYQGLGSNRLESPGLVERVVQWGGRTGWDESNLFVWEFPESQTAGASRGSAGRAGADPGSQLYTLLREMLAGPKLQRFVDPQTGREIGWDHPLIGARHLQMTGALVEAIREYNHIRQGVNVFNATPANALCLESAVYWTVACQYELGEDESVFNMGFGGQYPPYFPVQIPPMWADGMLQLTTFSLARSGRLAQAADFLGQAPSGEFPQGKAYLVRRWRRLASPAAAPESTGAATGALPSESGAPPTTTPAPSPSPADSPPTESSPPTPAATEDSPESSSPPPSATPASSTETPAEPDPAAQGDN